MLLMAVSSKTATNFNTIITLETTDSELLGGFPIMLPPYQRETSKPWLIALVR